MGSTSQLIDANNGTGKTRYDYKSYGKLEGDTDNRSLTNPYTYTGREDDGTGLYFYRDRFYDPELEIFISKDPLGDAMRYVGGNPIIYIDPLGLKPGDPYSTADAAAKQAIRDINPTSVAQDREHAGCVCQQWFGFGPYTYTPPRQGTAHSSNIGSCSPFDLFVGDYHTHGAESGPDWDDENFSPADKRSNDASGWPGYLGTPSGNIMKYFPKSKTPGLSVPIGRGAK